MVTVPNSVEQRHPGLGPRQLQHPLQRSAHAARRSRPGCAAIARRSPGELAARFTLAFSGTHEVFLTEPGPLAEALCGAVEAVTGRAPALTTNGGASDASFIRRHCPVIELGLPNATVHQVDEHVPLADLATLTAIYRRFIEGYLAA